MAFSYRDLFCGGKTFCCCLPVRMGVIAMSILGILFGGGLSVILWFVVANMTSAERAGFVVATLVETSLLVASILGLVGAIVRKQAFVQAYAYFIYVHFVLNIAVAGYLVYMVTHFTTSASIKACQDTIQLSEAQDQCNGLLKIARGVYFAVAAIVIVVEMYGALIVARYLNQVQSEKRNARASRLDSDEAFRLIPKGKGKDAQYSFLLDGQHRDTHLHQHYPSHSDFDPYEEVIGSGAGPSYVYEGIAPPIEVGYGGGSWTHQAISDEEKERMKKRDAALELAPVPVLHRDEIEQKSRDNKAPTGPPPTSDTREIEELPRYTLSDPPRPR